MPTRLFNFPLARHSACKLFEKIFHARELPPFSSFFYFYYFIIFRVTQRKLGPLTRPEGAVFCLFVSPSEITRLELDEESDGMKTKKKKYGKKNTRKEQPASERFCSSSLFSHVARAPTTFINARASSARGRVKCCRYFGLLQSGA